MKTLRSKAAGISLDDLDKETLTARSATVVPDLEVTQTSITSSNEERPHRKRSGVESITSTISMRHEIMDLKDKVAQLEDGALVVKLDPKVLRPSRWVNRHEESFASQSFQSLKLEIEAAGKNVQPIKVRRISSETEEPFQYEIVFGRRRHRACLELGLPVTAMIEPDMDDVALFVEMERENRNREDLTPWEQGSMYHDAIKQGLFASQRKLAAELGLSQSNVSSAIALVSLPLEVLDAFPSRLSLQYRWAADINAALERDRSLVLGKAKELATLDPKLPAKTVLGRLTNVESKDTESVKVTYKTSKGLIGSWVKDGKGSHLLRFKSGSLTVEQEQKLGDFLDRLWQ